MNELISKDSSFPAVIEDISAIELLKPLQNQIFLLKTFIAGTSHLKSRKVIEEMKSGDRLIMIREDNKYDEHAIRIEDQKKRKAGYVPKRDNLILSRLMDAGKKMFAEVRDIEQGESFSKIDICIYMKDF